MELDDLSGSLLGQYQVLEALGQGGMARVYKAMHPRLKRVVALKIILPEAAAWPGFRERFEREAQLIARLHHPDIVAVYDFGEAGGLPYLVMQYVGGGTLSSTLTRGQPLPVDRALSYTIQMARALQHAHSQDIIHRDIKPANMLLDEHDPTHLLLSDFGIAKHLSSAAEAKPGQPDALHSLTTAGSIIGTPEYMAPEQAQGGVVDARTDLYALGVVLYLFLTGQLPFRAATPLAVLYQHVHTTPPPLTAFNAAVSQPLAHVVSRALAKQPGERFQSAEAFARALEGLLPSASLLEHAPTLLSQRGHTVLAPGGAPVDAGSASASPPTPFLTQPADTAAPRPETILPDTTPTAGRNMPPPLQPGSSPVSPRGAHSGPPGFTTAPTPLPGQPPSMALPPLKRPRRRALPWLAVPVSLLLVMALLLLVPGSPIRWPLGLSLNSAASAPTQTPAPATQGGTTSAPNVTTDDFSVNTLGWPTGHINNDPGLDWTLGGGVYDLVIPAGAPYALSYPVLPSKLGTVPTDFSIEIKVKQVRGSKVLGFGLVFRTTVLGSSFQGDACTIDAEGGYQCVAYPSAASAANFTTNPAIHPGLNQLNDLKIIVQGGTLTFSVNGTRLPLEGPNGTMPGSLYSSGQVGLLVTGPGTEFQYTSFVLTPLP